MGDAGCLLSRTEDDFKITGGIQHAIMMEPGLEARSSAVSVHTVAEATFRGAEQLPSIEDDWQVKSLQPPLHF
jgi:hypothetical protein